MSTSRPSSTRPLVRLHHPSPDAARLGVDAEIALSREHVHYLVNVMRLGQGDSVLLFNSRDGEWACEIVEAGKRAAKLAARRRMRAPQTPPDVELLFAPIKKARTDFIVEKATELGCRRIRPVTTRRTNAERVNLERLRAHAVEAAEQCGLVFVPDVSPPEALERVLQTWPQDRRLHFCDEAGDAPPLADAVAAGPAAILIGPEGGFTPEERARIRATPGAVAVSLGPRILRADTAATAALAVWQARVGDWAGDQSPARDLSSDDDPPTRT